MFPYGSFHVDRFYAVNIKKLLDLTFLLLRKFTRSRENIFRTQTAVHKYCHDFICEQQSK